MALSASEVAQCKYQLGYPLTNVGAEPYISFSIAFDQVIAPHMLAGAITSSATSVTAATTATPVALTLADPSGFAVGQRVVVDVDDRQEIVTVQNLSGSALTVLLRKAHSGTYPVTVEGGESIVRGILRECVKIGGSDGLLSKSASQAGLKRVDEIEFYGDQVAITISAQQRKLLNYWRDELASALGIENLRSSSGGGACVGVY